jgi:hypothetical protein
LSLLESTIDQNNKAQVIGVRPYLQESNSKGAVSVTDLEYSQVVALVEPLTDFDRRSSHEPRKENPNTGWWQCGHNEAHSTQATHTALGAHHEQ